LVDVPEEQQSRNLGLLKETKDHVTMVTDLLNALDGADRESIYRLPDTATIADYRAAAFRQDVNFTKDKDPVDYISPAAELETYYEIVDRLVAGD
jgi:hypothetical protein